MFDLYARERESAAFGGGYDDMSLRDWARGQADDAGVQTAEVTPQGDMFAKNWVIAALVLFLFLYTVSRVLD
jgi:hypothetical protein